MARSPMTAHVRCFLPLSNLSVSAPLIVIMKEACAIENTAIGAAKYNNVPAMI